MPSQASAPKVCPECGAGFAYPGARFCNDGCDTVELARRASAGARRTQQALENRRAREEVWIPEKERRAKEEAQREARRKETGRDESDTEDPAVAQESAAYWSNVVADDDLAEVDSATYVPNARSIARNNGIKPAYGGPKDLSFTNHVTSTPATTSATPVWPARSTLPPVTQANIAMTKAEPAMKAALRKASARDANAKTIKKQSGGSYGVNPHNTDLVKRSCKLWLQERPPAPGMDTKQNFNLNINPNLVLEDQKDVSEWLEPIVLHQKGWTEHRDVVSGKYVRDKSRYIHIANKTGRFDLSWLDINENPNNPEEPRPVLADDLLLEFPKNALIHVVIPVILACDQQEADEEAAKKSKSADKRPRNRSMESEGSEHTTKRPLFGTIKQEVVDRPLFGTIKIEKPADRPLFGTIKKEKSADRPLFGTINEEKDVMSNKEKELPARNPYLKDDDGFQPLPGFEHQHSKKSVSSSKQTPEVVIKKEPESTSSMGKKPRANRPKAVIPGDVETIDLTTPEKPAPTAPMQPPPYSPFTPISSASVASTNSSLPDISKEEYRKAAANVSALVTGILNQQKEKRDEANASE